MQVHDDVGDENCNRLSSKEPIRDQVNDLRRQASACGHRGCESICLSLEESMEYLCGLLVRPQAGYLAHSFGPLLWTACNETICGNHACSHS